MAGRDITITLGDKVIHGSLPLMGDRFRLHSAYMEALGITFNGAGTDAEPEVGSPEDLMSVFHAAIGLCWPKADALDIPTLRELDRDLIEYGDHVFDCLWGLGYTDPEATAKGAQQLLSEIVNSIPTQDEVGEELGNSEAKGETSTELISQSD